MTFMSKMFKNYLQNQSDEIPKRSSRQTRALVATLSVGLLIMWRGEVKAQETESARQEYSLHVEHLTPAKIKLTVQRNMPKLRKCYQDELKKDKTLKGMVKVRFTIDANGRVSESQTIQDTIGSQPLARCVEAVIKRWDFKSRPKGGSVQITFPFVFAPDS